MSVHHQAATHDQLQAALDLAGVELRASEIHGMVCGEICRQSRFGCGPDFPSLVGVPESSRELGVHRALLSAVDELMELSRQALDTGLQFPLLLPDDEEPIEERTASLADWARGFVLALLRGDELAPGDLAEDSAEVVQDLLKISEARPGEDTEADERALAEIEEYVRVGVQLIFEELQPDGGHETSNKGNNDAGSQSL